jgi:hypothetical protein
MTLDKSFLHRRLSARQCRGLRKGASVTAQPDQNTVNTVNLGHGIDLRRFTADHLRELRRLSQDREVQAHTTWGPSSTQLEECMMLIVAPPRPPIHAASCGRDVCRAAGRQSTQADLSEIAQRQCVDCSNVRFLPSMPLGFAILAQYVRSPHSICLEG